MSDDEGTPVLVSVNDVGPIFGRLHLDEADYDLGDPFEIARPAGRKSWRVEIKSVPPWFLSRTRDALLSMAGPVDVRLHPSVDDRDPYVGRAFGQLDIGSYMTPGYSLTLTGQGEIRRELR
jgi:hypothetical protein